MLVIKYIPLKMLSCYSKYAFVLDEIISFPLAADDLNKFISIFYWMRENCIPEEILFFWNSIISG